MQSAALRDDVLNVRVSMSDAPVNIGSMGNRDNHFNSTHGEHFRFKSSEPGLRGKATSIHKNISRLPGFGEPPNPHDRFSTTSASTYQRPHTVATSKAAGTPRHHAPFKIVGEAHTDDVFGKLNDMQTKVETSAQAMNASTGTWQLKPKPRFVNGGSFRNVSTVALDRNLAKYGDAMDQDYGTTASSTWWGSPGGTRAVHRFDQPQKNTSTYLMTSMQPSPRMAEKQREEGAVGRLNARAPDMSRTQLHGRPSQMSYRQPAMSGTDHFMTTQGQHFIDHKTRLVVPPGKGGVDRSMSDVPLGSDFDSTTMTPQPHSHVAYTGAQLDELRQTCASRGTLGARGGLKLPRGSSGAPAGFFHRSGGSEIMATTAR